MGLASLAGFTEGLGSRIKEDREKMYAEIKDAASFYRQAGMKRLEERRGKKDKLTERFNTVKTLVGDSEYASNIADSAIRLSDSAFDDFMSTLKTNIDSIGQMEEFTQYTETQEPSEFMDDAGGTVPMVTSSTGKRTVDMDSVIGRYVSKDAKPTDVTVDNAVNSVLGTFKNTGIADNNPAATRLGDSFRGFFGTLTAEQKARKAYQKAGSLLGKSGDELEALLSSDGMKYTPTSTEGIALGIADPVRVRAQELSALQLSKAQYDNEEIPYTDLEGNEIKIRRFALAGRIASDKALNERNGVPLPPSDFSRVIKSLTSVQASVIPKLMEYSPQADLYVYRTGAEIGALGKLTEEVFSIVRQNASREKVTTTGKSSAIANYGSKNFVAEKVKAIGEKRLNEIYDKYGGADNEIVRTFKEKLFGSPTSGNDDESGESGEGGEGGEGGGAKPPAKVVKTPAQIVAEAAAAEEAAAEARVTRITQANAALTGIYNTSDIPEGKTYDDLTPVQAIKVNQRVINSSATKEFIENTFNLEPKQRRKVLTAYYNLNQKTFTRVPLTGELLQKLVDEVVPQAAPQAASQTAPQAAAVLQAAAQRPEQPAADIDAKQIFNTVNGKPREYIVRMIGKSPLYPMKEFPLANNARKNLIDKIVKELGDADPSPATIDAATKTVLTR